MVELIVSGSTIVALVGAICFLVEKRIDRIEDKVDWLLKKNGDDYVPPKIRRRSDNNDTKQDNDSAR